MSNFTVKLVENYWQYFFAGIICYISARFFYNFLGSKIKSDDDYKTPDQGKFSLLIF